VDLKTLSLITHGRKYKLFCYKGWLLKLNDNINYPYTNSWTKLEGKKEGKIKLALCLIKQLGSTPWRSGGIVPPFLTSPQD
jgi:hypothetical protein